MFDPARATKPPDGVPSSPAEDSAEAERDGRRVSRKRFLGAVGAGAGAIALDPARAIATRSAADGTRGRQAVRSDRFGRMFRLPPFAEQNRHVEAALRELGEPAGLLDANDPLSAGPKALIVDLSLSANNPNNPLVSPSSDKVIVKQRVCGSDAIEDFTWVFNQHAPAAMPESGPCDLSAYRPSNNGDFLHWGAELPPPYGVSFDDFDGEQANGTWSLHVLDRESGNVGDVEGGWTLTLTTGLVDSIVPATGTFAAATPYPATRTIAGQTGVITDVNVNVGGVWHQRPDDLDMLLVGPHGQKVVLMSDACGTSEAAGVLWEWNDEALAPMADGGGTNVCPTDGYRPTDHEPGDSWPAPAPPGPYANTLSVFDLTDPNGEWRLFVNDDSSDGVGFFTDRFVLGISTRPGATVAFTETAVDIAEGATRTLTLMRSGPTALGDGTVSVTSVPVSANSGGDFRPVSTVVRFAPKETEKTVQVDALADGDREPDEAYAVTLGSPTGDAAVGTPSSLAVTITEPPAAGGGGPGGGSPGAGGPGAGGYRTAPVLSRFSASPRRFRAGRTPRRRPKGTRLTLELSEAASVRFDARALVVGRRVGGRCRTPTRANRSRTPCTLRTRKGGFTRPVAAGRTTLAFRGRIGGRALKPGRYTLRATPTDAAGNAGTPRSIGIRIVR